jgi:hypothetical protein
MLKRTIPVATIDGFTPQRDDPSSRRPSAPRSTREARETRSSKRRPQAEEHAPRRERASDADDKNPDQAPISRAADRTHAPSALVSTGTEGRGSLHRKHPIPALLMKRSNREPEKV